MICILLACALSAVAGAFIWTFLAPPAKPLTVKEDCQRPHKLSLPRYVERIIRCKGCKQEVPEFAAVDILWLRTWSTFHTCPPPPPPADQTWMPEQRGFGYGK